MKRRLRPWIAPRVGGYQPTRPSDREILDCLLGDRPITPGVQQLVDAMLGGDEYSPRRGLVTAPSSGAA